MPNTDVKNNKKEFELLISVKDVLYVAKQNFLISILIGLVFAAMSFVYFGHIVKPSYTANTKVYVLNGTMTTDGNKRITNGDILAYTEVVKDFPDVVKSRTVAQEAIKKLGSDMTAEQLIKKINATYSTDSRVVVISATAGSPEAAKKLADEVTNAAIKNINKIFGSEIASIIDKANLPKSPSAPHTKRNALFAFACGFILTIAVSFALYCYNDTVKTEDDVNKYLDMSVLGVVPSFKKNSRRV